MELNKIVYFYHGLGNQMFQYAFYKSLELKKKNVFGDLNYYKKNSIHNGFELEKIFNISIRRIETNNDFFNFSIKRNMFQRIIRKALTKSHIILHVEKWGEKDVKKIINKKFIKYYYGWWQNEKYFKEIEGIIRKDFKFTDVLSQKNCEIKTKIEKSNSISIHIRRGDYIENVGLGRLAPLYYYKNAISYISKEVKNPVFFIFSNDIEWCKKNINIEFITYYIDWNNGEESYRDMQLMSLCKHNIIPNSSFSWWGAWLNSNPDKIVIAPEKWFNTDYIKWDYSNIVPDSWIKLKNY
ncbi:MAG: alpha-1,2-fucosyltransferase [Fusobacteriaceae bacterium]|jgi:hypothetical protein|nr:alpha-1,2-fucosyltransferase [Fusobacteriaceae bacterium]